MAALKAKPPKQTTPRKPKFLVFGKAGVGKTWGALEFPNCYFIDCEGGATLDHYQDKLEASGGQYLGPEDGSEDFATVLEQVRLLATTKHDFKTLVIDSFSKLFNTAVAVEYERLEKDKSFKDMTKTFGAEKKPAVARTKQIVRWLSRLDMTAILIHHEKALWAEGEQIGATFDGWEKLDFELDFILQIVKQGNARKAKVGKCRLEQFREGELFDWNYKTFAERYGVSVIESTGKPTAPATSEQIRIVQQLCEVVKVDAEDRIKWFEKAGVDSWGEMDSETIQKCIDFLSSKLPKAPAVA